ncbi:MAG TPA: (2Fe-2S) ferredoxin domain-containing protein [Defluviitoga sp.]|nr:(2Fe-2S) ferredoxin domain-containing protein [Defluviitoga sp.]HOP25307.1 (2Fe-2S) ferredoxin domain-containing protein [Defluviitoga sp.]HPZ29443.1 (2Fe-2S) ferredoxin domain-containing protein [Defluviitoga sp.]HQD63270.1 (2Fe-2S) ferredoxin domain-containing protein [Defluviitoga sp.]
MSKLNSIDELRNLVATLKKNDSENKTTYLKVALGTCGISSGAEETFNELLKVINETKLENVEVIKTGCLGYCYAEPTVEVNEPGKEPILYGFVTKSKVHDIVYNHLMEGKIVKELIVHETHKIVL